MVKRLDGHIHICVKGFSLYVSPSGSSRSNWGYNKLRTLVNSCERKFGFLQLPPALMGLILGLMLDYINIHNWQTECDRPHKDNLFRVELESFAVTVLIPSDFLQVYKYVLSGPQNLPRLGCISMQDVLWDDSRALANGLDFILFHMRKFYLQKPVSCADLHHPVIVSFFDFVLIN